MKRKFVIHNFISRIHRIQIWIFTLILGHDCPVPIIPIRRCSWKELFKWGPSFKYKGDEIVWSWKSRTWISICSEGTFATLNEVDQFWDMYDQYELQTNP